jgi:hypothetical protein
MAGKSREKNEYIIRGMSSAPARSLVSPVTPWRVAAVLATLMLSVATAACGGRLFGKVYEYEEDVYVSLDGSAEVVINASIPALVTLRGIDLPLDPAARLDRDQIRAAYSSPLAEVTRISRPWRRQGRRFVQVRVRVPDIRKLTGAAPFSWSTYELAETDGVVVYRQHIGGSALRPGTLQNFGWTGGELVAFRLHLPSRIVYHNARDLDTNETSNIARGNILSWEQHLTDRLDGRPISIELKMDRQSILHRTLWLFAGAFAAAVLLIVVLIWLTMRKGAKEGDPA